MLYSDLLGPKDNANRHFLLQIGGIGITLVFLGGRLLKQVLGDPLTYEFTLIDNQLVYTGYPPFTTDPFYAYIDADGHTSMEEVALIGVQNGNNKVFALEKLPLPNHYIIVVQNGVVFSPTIVTPVGFQYYHGSGERNVTLGTAPLATDRLRAFIPVPASSYMTILPTSGNLDSANTRFTLTHYTPVLGMEPGLLVTNQGLIQTRTLTAPYIGQYYQLDPQTILLGSAPAANESIQFLLIGNNPVTTNPYQFTCNKVAKKLGIWLRRNLDDPELEEVVSEVYREYIEMYQWTALYVDGTFATRAPKTNGTVTVEHGSRIVRGFSTSFDAGDIGSRFRLDSWDQSYQVTNVHPEQQALEIMPAWAGDTMTAPGGVPYLLFTTHYRLGVDIEYLFSLAGRNQLSEVSVAVLDRVDPTRTATSNEPVNFAYRGRTSKGELEIEVYPIPDRALVLRYWGIRRDVCTDGGHILRALETLVLNGGAAAGCGLIMAQKGDKEVQVWAQLMSRYEGKAQQILERIDSLDWTRSGVARVQNMRDANSMENDGTYAATHDLWDW